MKLLNIKIQGFKKFKNFFEINLDNSNLVSITGDNRKGKTSIMDAITWCLFGVNSNGSNRTEFMNRNSNEMIVELTFVDRLGELHTLLRRKEVKKDAILIHNNKVIDQKGVSEFIQDRKMFFSIFNPLYFTSQKPAEQRELLLKILPSIPENTIIDMLNLEEKQIVNKKIDVPRYSIENNNNFSNSNKFKTLNKSKEEDAVYNTNTYLQLRKMDKDIAEKELIYLIGQKDYICNEMNMNINKPQIFDRENELASLEKELKILNSNTADLDISICKSNKEKLCKKKEQLEKELVILLDRYKKQEIKKNNYNSNTSSCPTCNSTLENNSHYILKIKGELEEELNNILIMGSEKNSELERIEVELKKEELIYQNLSKTVSPDDVLKRKATIKEEINRLLNLKNNILQQNQLIKMQLQKKEEAVSKLEDFEDKISKMKDIIIILEKQIQIAKSLTKKIAAKKVEFIKKYLKNTNIQFQKENNENELVDDYKLLYEDREFSMLSLSEKISVGLEISSMFNKVNQFNYFVFLDNAESISDIKHDGSNQLIIASVVKNAELNVKCLEIGTTSQLSAA